MTSREYAREESFETIPFGAMCLYHKTCIELSLMFDALCLQFLFQYFLYFCASYSKRSVKRSNKHVFDRRNYKELWVNLIRTHLLKGL